MKKKNTLTVEGCKSGLRSLAVLIVVMLLVSASPSGALASHSSIVRVDFGCGFRCGERMLKAGVFERLAAIRRRFGVTIRWVKDFSRI